MSAVPQDPKTTAAPAARISLRLYVAGQLPNSTEAVIALQALCAAHGPDAPQVEVVDVLGDPARALREGILVTPTLVRRSPLPEIKLLGNLADTERVRSALGLGRPAAIRHV